MYRRHRSNSLNHCLLSFPPYPYETASMLALPSCALAFLASCSLLVSAVPAPAPASDLLPRDLKDLTLYGLPEGVDPTTFAKRSTLHRRGQSQDHFHGSLPSCSDDDDPSYAQGKSAYKDGDGTLVQSGLCDNKIYTGGWHCWYVAFLLFLAPCFTRLNTTQDRHVLRRCSGRVRRLDQHWWSD